jgi:acyl-CoA thioesterase I
MKCRVWPALLAVLLAACGNDAPQPAASPAARGATAPAAEVTGPERRILAFGDSLFAGYRVGRSQSYPAQLQAALRARGINALVTNSGVSGDTTASGLQRIEFVLDGGPRPDLVIVELGGNDLLRGISPLETRENLDAILAELDERNVPVLLMGMRAPPNLGETYVQAFDAIYPELAERHHAVLVPFFLESVYDKPALIQADHVHPTAEGIEKIVATTVDEVAGALPD